MKTVTLILSLFSTLAFAANHDLSDFCGPVQYSPEGVEITVSEKTYRVVSGENVTIEQLKEAVPNGEFKCLRARQDFDDPLTLILFSF